MSMYKFIYFQSATMKEDTSIGFIAYGYELYPE